MLVASEAIHVRSEYRLIIVRPRYKTNNLKFIVGKCGGKDQVRRDVKER